MKFIAKLTHAANTAPLAEVKKNTFGSVMTLSEPQPGNYILSADQPVFAGMIECNITNQVFCNEDTGDIVIIRLQKISDSAIDIRVQDRQTNLIDFALSQWADNIITINS